MIDRRMREEGQRRIEAALDKIAETSAIFNPTLGTLKAQKTKELGASVPSAQAVVPKVLSTPSNT